MPPSITHATLRPPRDASHTPHFPVLSVPAVIHFDDGATHDTTLALTSADLEGQRLGPTNPSTGPSPALRARAEAGWQRFLDRWPETPGPEVSGPEETETPEGPEG
ncbi:hypothetical protein ACGFRB_16040 [Streptomyces sp. NPDC048718]|uniref:hypothetical protein n=1 Tax=Streptomyces sp. NPDC048718 TaxID=3365587 RepID=UPI0037148FA5